MFGPENRAIPDDFLKPLAVPGNDIIREHPKGRKTMRNPLPFLFAFLLGFIVTSWVGFENNRSHSEGFMKAALIPLSISVKTGDDLLALDWARRFENLEGIEAFQAIKEGKTLATGGVTSRLGSSTEKSFQWLPPALFRSHVSEKAGIQGTLDLDVLYRTSFNPLLWGGLGGTLCLLGVLFGHWRADSKHHSQPQNKPNPQPRSPLDKSHRDHSHDNPENLHPSAYPLRVDGTPTDHLRLDARWTIQEASSGLELRFEPTLPSLVGHHLLDLDPHIDLLSLIEKAQKGIASQGFNRFPGFSASTTPLPDGGVLIHLASTSNPTKEPLKP
jgi:hypothetical protein